MHDSSPTGSSASRTEGVPPLEMANAVLLARRSSLPPPPPPYAALPSPLGVIQKAACASRSIAQVNPNISGINERSIRAREAWQSSGLPLRHRRKAESGELSWPDVSAYERAWATAMNGGLVALIGPRGTGKTQLAAALMHAMYDQGRHVRYLRCDDLMDLMRRTQGGDEGDMLREVNRISRIDLLVIDECQERRDTEFEDRTLGRIIDKRYGAIKSTVLIANLRPDELQDSMGASTLSRMQETGTIIECNWTSFRDK